MTAPGAVSSRFEVAELVGAGGMGMVYRARDRATGRAVGPADGDPARAVLIDFGIAALASSCTRRTTTGTVLGTAAYMAPEQARGGGLADGRCDLFSLGSVLFRALTGRPPSAD